MNDTTKVAKDTATKDDETKAVIKETPKAPATKTYMVQKGAIAPNGGRRSDLIRPGEPVELTNAQARHYLKLERIAPFIPEDDEDDKQED